MANFSGKYLRVWKVEENNGYVKLNLGDSSKKKDGTYENWTWFGCALFGEAAKKTFFEGDVVEVTSGQIYQEKYNEKWYTRVKIFHLHKMNSDGSRVEDNQEQKPASSPFQKEDPKKEWGKFVAPKTEEGQGPGSFEDDIPF